MFHCGNEVGNRLQDQFFEVALALSNKNTPFYQHTCRSSIDDILKL